MISPNLTQRAVMHKNPTGRTYHHIPRHAGLCSGCGWLALYTYRNNEILNQISMNNFVLRNESK